MNRVDRLMAYLLLFQSRGLMRAQDFAREFEISERTVYRDIQALSEMGVPVVAMPGEGYRLMEGYFLPPIAFSAGEARALFLAVSMFSGLTSPGSTRQATLSALEKIRAVLPAVTLRQIEALEAIIRFYVVTSPALDFDNPRFVGLQEAIDQRRVVHLRYHALHTNEVTEREVEPIELLLVDRVWILSAYCRLRQGTRAFRLDRIDKMTVRSEQFPPREPGERSFEPGPVEVVVRFQAPVVRWVRERQHFSWVDEETVGQDVVMVYRPRSFDQIEGWLLSWGDRMTVISPVAFRERLAATARRILARHQT